MTYRGDPSINQCTAITARWTRCKRTAMHGHTECDTHGMVFRYYIQLQRRSAYNGGPRNSWRSYRTFSVWPLLFWSRQEAHEFMSKNFTFVGYSGNKRSAAVQRTRRKFLKPILNG